MPTKSFTGMDINKATMTISATEVANCDASDALKHESWKFVA
jgi:hypothetical protein